MNYSSGPIFLLYLIKRRFWRRTREKKRKLNLFLQQTVIIYHCIVSMDNWYGLMSSCDIWLCWLLMFWKSINAHSYVAKFICTKMSNIVGIFRRGSVCLPDSMLHLLMACATRNTKPSIIRWYYRFASSQWETSLQSLFGISHRPHK